MAVSLGISEFVNWFSACSSTDLGCVKLYSDGTSTVRSAPRYTGRTELDEIGCVRLGLFLTLRAMATMLNELLSVISQITAVRPSLFCSTTDRGTRRPPKHCAVGKPP